MTNLIDKKLWTYGAELEWSSLDQRKGLPKGFGWDVRDITMVNPNGIAVDPKGKAYSFGGEINTPPTSSIKAQVAAFEEVLAFHPDATVNHRSNLHLHIRVPGLKDDLTALKKIQSYIHKNRGYLDIIEPIPEPQSGPDEDANKGAVRRFNRRKISHHCTITEDRYHLQQKATTIEEFFAAEAPKDKKGKPLFHLSPRNAVNLRQLKETDTIEFRHFPGTLSPESFRGSLMYVRDWLYQALTDHGDPVELYNSGDYNFPKFKKYVHWRECLYRKTVHDGTVPKEEIAANIKKILSGEWSEKNYPYMFDRPAKEAEENDDGLELEKPIAINIRGTSGSGKTTIILNLLASINPTPVINVNGKVVGYVSHEHKLFIVGKYETPTGGCDGINKISKVFSRADKAIAKGYSVIFEGLLLSGLVSRFEDICKKVPTVMFALDTNMETCLERVVERRRKRGEFQDLNPKNTIEKARAAVTSTSAIETRYPVTIYKSGNREAYYKMGRLLNLKLQKFVGAPPAYLPVSPLAKIVARKALKPLF